MKRRDFVKKAPIAAGAVMASSPVPLVGEAPARTSQAARAGRDLALVNGRVITLEPERPLAEAVLVEGGRITGVGTNEEVRAQARGAPVFDAAGRGVVPGFIDSHVHFSLACCAEAYQAKCHAPPLRSLRDMIEVLRAKAAETPPGEWVIGRANGGMVRNVEEGRRPNRYDLDAVSDQHPVVLFGNFHVGMYNTIGLERAGLWEPSAATQNMRGVVVERDEARVPTGIVTEVWTLPEGGVSRYSRTEVSAAIAAHASDLFVRKGITTIHELPFSADDVRAIQDTQASGDLPIRMRMFYHLPHLMSLDELLAMGLLPGAGDDMFCFGGIKIFADGGGAGDPLKWTAEELNVFVYRAHAAGMQLMIHVLTEGGFDMAVGAVELAERRNPRGLRHRLEHAGGRFVPELLPRLKAVGLRPVITISGGAPGSRELAYLVRAGIDPMACSDATGTEPVFSPLAGIASMMHHSEATPPNGSEDLGFEDALRLWTQFNARGGFEENDKGTIAPGKLGDLVVLSGDPRGLGGERVGELDVDATILGGEVVFER